MKKLMTTITAIGLTAMLTAGTASAAAQTHIANDNDTFWKLSIQYNVPLDILLGANPTIDPLNVYNGIQIKIPDQPAPLQAMSKAEATPIAPAPAATPVVKAANGQSYSYSKQLQLKATAYSAAASENGGWGAVDYFGNKLKVGTVAVDPNMIPLGTKLYITGYSYNGLPAGGMIAVASDMGGSIKGNRIDIFVPGTTSQAAKFGIQDIKAYIID